MVDADPDPRFDDEIVGCNPSPAWMTQTDPHSGPIMPEKRANADALSRPWQNEGLPTLFNAGGAPTAARWLPHWPAAHS